MDTGQNAFFIGCFGLQNLSVSVSKALNGVIALPAVGADAASSRYIGLNKGFQFRTGAIFNYLKPNSAQFFAFPFHSSSNRKFSLGSAAPFARSLTAKVKLICFDIAGKFFTVVSDRTAAKFVEPTPGGVIAAKTQQIFEVDGIDTGFSSCKPPHRFEPSPQRPSGAMHDGSGSQRMLGLTAVTHVKSLGGLPVFSAAAFRTDKAGRPSAYKQVFTASVFIRKAPIKFGLIFRKIFCVGSAFKNSAKTIGLQISQADGSAQLCVAVL